MTIWHSPYAFIFVPVVLGMVGYVLWNRRSKNASLQFSRLHELASVPPGLRARLADLPTVLKVVALVLVVAALARPQQPNTQVRRNVKGIDIMFCLDISDSMLIEDMQPVNRIESSKKWIGEFIKGRTSDRIGLIIFAGESYMRVPPTLDYPLLLHNLKQVGIDRNIKMGTAIGVGLANAVAQLKDSKAKTKIVIFMTDGENNSGTIDPDTALEIAKGYGIKIYSIGMGRDGESQLPVYITDPFGRTIKEYRPIHSDVNVPLLKKFATETGGKFYRATEGTQLKDVFADIDRLEKTKILTDKYTRYAELYQKYLGWAIALYVLSAVLGQTLLRRGP